MDSNIQRSVRNLVLFSVLAGTMALTTGSVATAGQEAGQKSSNSHAKQIQERGSCKSAPMTAKRAPQYRTSSPS